MPEQKQILSKEEIWDEQSRLIPEDDESDGAEIAETVAGKRIMFEDDFYDALKMFFSQSRGCRWIKGINRLPGLFTEVEWRNADGGIIPLGKRTPLDHYQKAGANINWHEWLDESSPDTGEAVDEEDLIIQGLEEGTEMWKAEYDNCRKVLIGIVENMGSTEWRNIAVEEAKTFLSKYQHTSF